MRRLSFSLESFLQRELKFLRAQLGVEISTNDETIMSWHSRCRSGQVIVEANYLFNVVWSVSWAIAASDGSFRVTNVIIIIRSLYFSMEWQAMSALGDKKNPTPLMVEFLLCNYSRFNPPPPPPQKNLRIKSPLNLQLASEQSGSITELVASTSVQYSIGFMNIPGAIT